MTPISWPILHHEGHLTTESSHIYRAVYQTFFKICWARTRSFVKLSLWSITWEFWKNWSPFTVCGYGCLYSCGKISISLSNFNNIPLLYALVFQISPEDKFALSIITYIGCGLSLVGVVGAMLSIILFTYVSEYRRALSMVNPIILIFWYCLIVFRGLSSERNIIHANLLASMAVYQVIFLAGIEPTGNKV